MVVAIYVSLEWRSQSSSPNLWGVRSSKRLRWRCEIFCLQGGSSYYHRFDCTLWFRDEHHSTRIWGGLFAQGLGLTWIFCVRRGASDDHCDICTVWSCGTHPSPWLLQDVCSEILVDMIALFHRSRLWRSAVVRLVFAMWGHEGNITPPWESRTLQEAWKHVKVGLQFPSLKKKRQWLSMLSLRCMVPWRTLCPFSRVVYSA